MNSNVKSCFNREHQPGNKEKARLECVCPLLWQIKDRPNYPIRYRSKSKFLCDICQWLSAVQLEAETKSSTSYGTASFAVSVLVQPGIVDTFPEIVIRKGIKQVNVRNTTITDKETRGDSKWNIKSLNKALARLAS